MSSMAFLNSKMGGGRGVIRRVLPPGFFLFLLHLTESALYEYIHTYIHTFTLSIFTLITYHLHARSI